MSKSNDDDGLMYGREPTPEELDNLERLLKEAILDQPPEQRSGLVIWILLGVGLFFLCICLTALWLL